MDYLKVEDYIEVTYRYLDFHEGLAAVKDGEGLYGYIDKTGKEVIACKSKYVRNYVRNFHEDLAVVQDERGQYGYIDRTGKEVFACKYEYAKDFHEGLASVKTTNGIFYYINNTNDIMIEFSVYVSTIDIGITRVIVKSKSKEGLARKKLAIIEEIKKDLISNINEIKNTVKREMKSYKKTL